MLDIRDDPHGDVRTVRPLQRRTIDNGGKREQVVIDARFHASSAASTSSPSAENRLRLVSLRARSALTTACSSLVSTPSQMAMNRAYRRGPAAGSPTRGG